MCSYENAKLTSRVTESPTRKLAQQASNGLEGLTGACKCVNKFKWPAKPIATLHSLNWRFCICSLITGGVCFSHLRITIILFQHCGRTSGFLSDTDVKVKPLRSHKDSVEEDRVLKGKWMGELRTRKMWRLKKIML